MLMPPIPPDLPVADGIAIAAVPVGDIAIEAEVIIMSWFIFADFFRV
jgi:hypothetical protein